MTEKFEKKYDCGILNFWSSNNYGALLTCYALQESVKELGLVPGIINYHCRWEKFEGLLSDRFSRKYLDLTEPCADFEDLRRLNRQMQTFIAGSDQIWRYKYFWPRGKNIYQLSFASLNARKRELQQEQRRADEEREARLKELRLEKELLEQECEGIRESIEKYEAMQREFGTGSSMENISRNSRENQEYEAHYADDESGIHARYHEQTGSTEDWQPEKTGYILSFFAILIAIILFGFKVYITPALFWTGELAALAIALFSAIRQYKKNQNRAKLQAASMQAEQLRKLREQEVMEAQMQQKKRLADQMLTEWKDSLWEKENRLFNLEEEITRQSVQSWAEHQRAEDIQALELAAQEITRISQSFYEDMQDELNAEISRYVSLFTAGAYDSVRLDEQGQLQILTEGREVRPELLSRGTLEQIYLALRLAVGKVVTKEETLPILLDEAFAMYDDDRLAQTLQTLSTLQNQIFLFTCQKREVEMLKKMKLDYNLIEMEAYH